MSILSKTLLLSCTGLLASCAVLSSQPPIAPGQNLKLQSGEGIAALLMDTQDPVTQVLLEPINSNGPMLDLPSMPAGRTLALFAVPAGVYCLKQFSYGRYRFFSKTPEIGCFQVSAGRISYSGNIRPSAGRDPETGRDAALVDQIYQPDDFMDLLKKQYPQLMSSYPTAGPSNGSDSDAHNNITQELASWIVEAADHRSYDVFLRNNANWPIMLTEFNITKCTNIKQKCGDQYTDVTLQPNTTIKYISMEQADAQQAYEFQYEYNYKRLSLGTKQ